MAFFGHNSHSGAEPPQPALDSAAPEGLPQSSSGGQARTDDDGYRALLDVVLQQTLLAQESRIEEKPESLESLLEVARRRRGEAFQFDPIGIELVQTVLEKPFRSLVTSQQQWLAMTRQVAQTLCDDAATYDRLCSLWRRLGERCGNGN